MKHIILLSFLSFIFFPVKAVQPVQDLVKRLLPTYEKQFIFEIEPSGTNEDFFEISSEKEKIYIKASNTVSLASGLNWYLKYYCYCSFSFCGNQVELPAKLPVVDKKLRKATPLTYNFYMNYCTFSYTAAFWDWKRWEREIDLMALNGITTPMAMVGAEVVWRNTLRQFNYTDKEIKDFICGPGYLGWFLMDNLEKIGGPLPDEWFERQTELQKKIVTRMRELGMKPVFQAFFGMVPNSLRLKYPEAQVVDQGEWMGFKRPPILLSDDPLFDEMSEVWYEEYEKLFGKTDCFAGDLFHEGGRTEGIDVKAVANGVQAAMLRYTPDAKWFIQAWGGNPKGELLAGLDKKHTVVVDLCAEFWTVWKNRKGFDGFPWIWSHVTNYGGNVGLHGRLDAIACGSVDGRADPDASKSMIGIGATPEGIELNPITFELANEMRWHTTSPDMYQWIKEYAHRRYGVENKYLAEAWKLFYETAYGSYDKHRRPSESVFCATPSLKGKRITASAWSQCKTFYDTDKFAKGVALFLKPALSLKEQETYQFDAVDMVRQYLSDLGRDTYYKLTEAYEKKDEKTFRSCSDYFLQLLLDQDKLLSSHEYFFVGKWLNMARSASAIPAEQDLYERNARQLIGTWTEEKTSLRDYGHREWGGMLIDYYYPRWEVYLRYLGDKLAGKEAKELDLFLAERTWIEARNPYVIQSTDPVQTAVKLFNKHFKIVH